MSTISTKKTYALVAAPANKKLVAAVENAGAGLILFPQISTAPRLLDFDLRRSLAESLNYDWLIFFDVLAVDYYLEKLSSAEIDPFELDEKRICALGEAVADRLRFVQLHSDVIPVSRQPAAILKALENYIGDSLISGTRCLSIKRASAAFKFEAELSKRGAAVSALEIYDAKIDRSLDGARLAALLKGGAVDEFVFTSPEDVISMQIILNRDVIGDFFIGTNVSATDGVTAQTLREQDLRAGYFSIK